MTLKDAMGKVMVSLDEVTSHNLTANVDDYIYKMYPLFDSVQRELATLGKPIKRYADVTAVEGYITLPADCYEPLAVFDGDMKYVSYEGTGVNAVRVAADGNYKFYYNAYPSVITSATPDTYEFEIDRDAQEALIYGVCAGLCINDEPELYNTYIDRYNTYMANIIQRMNEYPKGRIYGGVRI